MTNKIRVMIWLTMFKYLIGLLIIPTIQLVKLTNSVGSPDFYSVLLWAIIYIIISLSFVNYFHFEMFLSKEEHEWINKEVNRLRNLK